MPAPLPLPMTPILGPTGLPQPKPGIEPPTVPMGPCSPSGNKLRNNGDLFNSDKDAGKTVEEKTKEKEDGTTQKIRKVKDGGGNTVEVWHEIYDSNGNIIHRDWKGPGLIPPKKPFRE